jgi:hypothetical protein
MSLDHLPSNIEQGIEHFAKQRNLSHDEALLLLIETGLQCAPSASRRQRPKKGPQPPLRTGDPEGVIGLFADRPEIVDSILQVVEERSQRYTSGN